MKETELSLFHGMRSPHMGHSCPYVGSVFTDQIKLSYFIQQSKTPVHWLFSASYLFRCKKKQYRQLSSLLKTVSTILMFLAVIYSVFHKSQAGELIYLAVFTLFLLTIPERFIRLVLRS